MLKTLLKKVIYRPGTLATIRIGPLKGYRYRVSENAGWAPLYGGWEPEAVRLFQKVIEQDDVIYDLGANTGIHSLLFSKLAIQGTVYAFEPLPLNIDSIKETISLNRIDNIQVKPLAVSDEQGTVDFKIGLHNKQGSLVGIGRESGSVIRCQTDTLDHLAATIQPPSFIKIDIEGAESLALNGFTTISQYQPLFSIDLHTPEQDVLVGEYFQSHGYRIFRVRNDQARQLANQSTLLKEIAHPTQGWPHPEGTWGVIFCVPPTYNTNRLKDLL